MAPELLELLEPPELLELLVLPPELLELELPPAVEPAVPLELLLEDDVVAAPLELLLDAGVVAAGVEGVLAAVTWMAKAGSAVEVVAAVELLPELALMTMLG